MFCPDCGGNVGIAKRFCRFCGASLSEPASPPTPGRLNYATANATPYAAAAEKPDLEGVWGWLLFFCLLVTVLSPIFFLIDVHRRLSLMVLVSWLLVLFDMFVGVNLWGRSQYALKVLKIYFFVLLPLAALALIASVVIPLAAPEEISISMTRFIVSVLKLAFLGAWFAYFRTSRRVKATYGSNL